jgi:hypothetical protein
MFKGTFFRNITLAALLFSCFVLVSCVDVTIRPGMPTYMSKLAIPTFLNRTSQQNLETELTQQFSQDFMVDGRLEITDPDHANAILLGTVTTYQLEPMLMDVHNTPQQYKMRLILYLALKDVKAGKNLWVEEKFEDSVTYYAANTLNLPPETEQAARKRLIQKLSTRLIARVIEGF